MESNFFLQKFKILKNNFHFYYTGRDCMDNVCRRVNLQQPDLFGLKFYSRRPYPKYRWVDLDRPLKKQLDKYAQQPTGRNHALKRYD